MWFIESPEKSAKIMNSHDCKEGENDFEIHKA